MLRTIISSKLAIFFVFVFSNVFVWAQGNIEPIQFSGVVFTGDSNMTVPYTTLYIPKTGRGVVSNQYGIFSMPVLPKDSVVIIATGFKKTHYIVPIANERKSISVMIELKQDTLELPTVEVFPYQTEEIFKQAFLALQLPENQHAGLEQTMNDRIIAMMSSEAPADGQMNHSWYAKQYAITQERKYQSPMAYNPLFNPFAWAQFINSLRKGAYKKKEYDEKGKKKTTSK
jgi:hypothetical protein